jgi:Peptidase family M28
VERWWLLAIVACSTPPPPPAKPAVAPPDPFAEASLTTDVAWLADRARQGRASREATAATAAWLQDQLRKAHYTAQQVAIPDFDQVDVIAELGRTGPPVVIVAHYDHLGEGFPGANDNASGVAVALAVARAQPRGHVVFLFTGGEERGLRGARAYVAAPTVKLADIRAVFNLDMVGHDFFGNQPATLAGVGLSDHDDLGKLAADAAGAAGLTLLPFPASAVAMLGQDHRSDDWVFRDLGIPAVHFSTGLDDTYHQPSDTPDKIVPAQLARTARFLYALVQRVNR